MVDLQYHFLQWFRSYHFIYVFGLLIYFKPIDPFLYELLTTKSNLTETEYLREAYPMSAYTSVVFSLFLFLFISFIGFPYVFIIAFIGGLTFSCAIMTDDLSLVDLQVAEAFYGGKLATDFMYYTSIYVCNNVNGLNIPRVTSYIWAIPLIAKILSAVLGQIIMSHEWLDYGKLAFISVPLYFNLGLLMVHLPAAFVLEEVYGSKIAWFKSKFKNLFSNRHILKWSLWTAFSYCGYVQVTTAIQSLWKENQLKYALSQYNAIVEVVLALLALIAVLFSRIIKTNWKFHNSILLLTSLLQGVLLLIIASSSNVWVFNISYIVFGIVYHFVVASLCSAIAKKVLRHGGYFEIVFAFIGLVSSILNLIFVCVFNVGINTTIQQQFVVYGGCHLGVAMMIIVSWFIMRR